MLLPLQSDVQTRLAAGRTSDGRSRVDGESGLGLDPGAALGRVVCVSGSEVLAKQDSLADRVEEAERPGDELLPDDVRGLGGSDQFEAVDHLGGHGLRPKPLLMCESTKHFVSERAGE